MNTTDYNEKSFELKYVGARFKGARLPVDVLSDLPAFRDLLIAFAKDGWRELNSNRQRVPKHFDKSLSFDLVAIEPGSAVPKINWNRGVAQTCLPGFVDQLEEIVDASFKKVISLIDDAGHDYFPQSMSSEYIRALNKFGSSLRPDEKIEFQNTKGKDGNVVYLDLFRRKKLITKIQETYQARLEGIGILRGCVTKNGTNSGYVLIYTEKYGEIKIILNDERIVSEFDGNINSDVQFDLQIELDNNDRYISTIDAFDVVLIDAQIESKLIACQKRITDIGNLKDEWLDGDGKKISPQAVSSAQQFLLKRPSLCGSYKIYPTEYGDILFEFEQRGWDFSIEFKADGFVEMYGVEINGDKEMEVMMFNEVNEEFMSEFDRRVGR